MIKGYRSCVWSTKNLEIWGTNLTTANYANIPSQVKIIDTLKYYQTTLAGLTSATDEKEKENIKTVVKQFISKHSYFENVWRMLEEKDKDKILDLIAEGKGVMPYEKIVTFDSLLQKPLTNTLNFIEV